MPQTMEQETPGPVSAPPGSPLSRPGGLRKEGISPPMLDVPHNSQAPVRAVHFRDVADEKPSHWPYGWSPISPAHPVSSPGGGSGFADDPVDEPLLVPPLPDGGPGVKHLFVAWTRHDVLAALFATAASAAVAAAKTTFAVLLGQVFQAIADFGSGATSAPETVRRVATWCLALTGLGVGTAVFSGLLMAGWIVHGETRARSVRLRLFQALLAKDMVWFDTRRGGMASLMTEQDA